MKIWIINHNAIPPKYGALVRHYYFGKYLHEKGDDIVVFTSSQIHNSNLNVCEDGTKFLCENIDGITYVFIKNRKYSGNGLDRIINMCEFALKVGRLDKKFEKPDVIYASSPDIFAAISAQHMAKRIKLPFVLEVRDLWPESIVQVRKIPERNPIIKLLYIMEKRIYKEAKKIIFTMPGGINYIRDKGWDNDIELKKIEYVNNGVDVEEFKRNIEDNQLQDEDLLCDKIKVVYCGSIRKANDIGKIIDAARTIKNQGYDDIIFLMYGDGVERQALEELANKEKLPVKFKGKVDRKYIPYILSRADLNILNYVDVNLLEKYGSSSNKLFEYIASGKPIISNRILLNDVIVENGLGSAKNFVNSEEYAMEILRLCRLNEEEKENIRRSADRVIKEFDYRSLAKKIYEVLHD